MSLPGETHSLDDYIELELLVIVLNSLGYDLDYGIHGDGSFGKKNHGPNLLGDIPLHMLESGEVGEDFVNGGIGIRPIGDHRIHGSLKLDKG